MARNANTLNPDSLAIVPSSHWYNEVNHWYTNLQFINRDPEEIKVMYMKPAKQVNVNSLKKEVDEYCRHLWQQEVNQGLMYSNYSGLKVKSSIMKMLAPYPRKVSFKTLRVLMNDFEVGEVLFGSGKIKTDICPHCKTVDDTAHFLFSCVLHQENRMNFIKELKSQQIDENLVSLLNCENMQVIVTLSSQSEGQIVQTFDLNSSQLYDG